MPLARDVVKDLAVEHGACIRPIQLRRTDLATGETEPVLVPCGHTLASVCPSCAERAKSLRAAQCREGWHLEREPVIEPDDPTDHQQWLIGFDDRLVLEVPAFPALRGAQVLGSLRA